ncbi:AMP-dependent ligase [Streptomyces spiroverticillatus]|uniref:AMP-dependent ligase n=1 Tax=Streptomyces finlayi TaxID=67296 RepID=A0A918X5L1_9ACTN|nr:AMP-binding protein [Streptomyces finlayi]GHA42624.1 AMP-dependent ligase [Streptomyces spiroverticillatus]GHD13760.1 AMP-dependent ligase [Streptomyces finlayi]
MSAAVRAEPEGDGTRRVPAGEGVGRTPVPRQGAEVSGQGDRVRRPGAENGGTAVGASCVGADGSAPVSGPGGGAPVSVAGGAGAGQETGSGPFVTDLLDAAAVAWPDSVAVRDEGGAWSHAGLADASRAVAGRLRRAGVGPGDRVVLRLGNRREFVALYYGVLRAGAVVVPLNPEMKPFVLRGVLADAAPALVVLDPAEPEAVRDVVAGCGARAVAPAELLAGGASGYVPGPVPRSADAVAQLIYTSGSTSAPKGVVCTHRQVVFAARAIARRLGYGPGDVVLAALPLSFDYGLYQLLLAAIGGCEVVLADASAPVRVLSLLREHRATVVPVVPSLAEMLCRLAARGTPPAHVRLFTSTGAALPGPAIDALRTRFPGAAVVAMYGITECKRVTVAAPDADRDRPGAVGLPLDGTTVAVLDARGRVLGPGQVGEIVVGGPHVMSGYWNAPGQTAARYRPDPAAPGRTRLHTGDHGHLDADGHLYVGGRVDDQFKRRGVRMSTPEIEAAALDVPGVRTAAALPPRDGLDLRLVVTGERDLTERQVLDGLALRLEAAKVPARCRIVDRLPLTPNGKTDKKALDTDEH